MRDPGTRDDLSSTSARWQPMGTAPKDGTRILVWDAWPRGSVYPAAWSGAPHNVWRKDSGGDAAKPTHWMPLPAPPKEHEERGGGEDGT